MKWPELAFAVPVAAILVALHVLPGDWCEPLPVRAALGVFVALVGGLYISLVDSACRQRVSWAHRVLTGGVAGLVIAFIADGPPELYALSVLLGVGFGYSGNYLLGWLKHVS